jgi:hypothetical protein
MSRSDNRFQQCHLPVPDVTAMRRLQILRESLIHDARGAIRELRAGVGFTVAAVLSLALAVRVREHTDDRQNHERVHE